MDMSPTGDITYKSAVSRLWRSCKHGSFMAAVRTFIVKSSTLYPITFPEKILSFLAIPCRKSYNDLSRLFCGRMEFSMKKFKRIRRIFAWIGIVVLVGLYVTTLILAFSGSPMAQALFRGSFAATVVFPVPEGP